MRIIWYLGHYRKYLSILQWYIELAPNKSYIFMLSRDVRNNKYRNLDIVSINEINLEIDADLSVYISSCKCCDYEMFPMIHTYYDNVKFPYTDMWYDYVVKVGGLVVWQPEED